MDEFPASVPVDPIRSLIASDPGSSIELNVDLGGRTTYRVGGRADALVTVGSPGTLSSLAAICIEAGTPVLVLGRGSNTLVADRGFRGVVIQLGPFADFFEVERNGGSHTPVTCRLGAGVALPVAARRTAALGLSGFEWAVGVPGSIGGAVRMNAGGHGSDMRAVLKSATVLDLVTGSAVERNVDDLGLGFRTSALSDDEVVIDASLALAETDPVSAGERVDEIVRWRRQHQPGGQNCGSVFVNPVPGQVTAGGLIDGLGLRGMRIGTAEVSPRHANFIQADPDGQSDDVVSVIREVRRRVYAETGYRLRTEVRLVGFDPAIIAELAP